MGFGFSGSRGLASIGLSGRSSLPVNPSTRISTRMLCGGVSAPGKRNAGHSQDGGSVSSVRWDAWVAANGELVVRRMGYEQVQSRFIAQAGGCGRAVACSLPNGVGRARFLRSGNTRHWGSNEDVWHRRLRRLQRSASTPAKLAGAGDLSGVRLLRRCSS